MAWAPRASAPLVEAVTEAMTASRFFLEWALTSFSEARDFSTASLNATLPAVVNCSTVFLTVSAAAMGYSPEVDCGGGGRRNANWAGGCFELAAYFSCCSAAVKGFLCSAASPPARAITSVLIGKAATNGLVQRLFTLAQGP